MKLIKARFLWLFFVIVLITIAQSSFGQRRNSIIRNLPHYDYLPFNFGFVLGLNTMDFSLSNYGTHELANINQRIQSDYGELMGIRTRQEQGFHIGISSTLKLADMLDLRFVPTLSFGDRNIVYRFSDNSTLSQPLEVTNIEFPLHLKFKSQRMDNIRAYLLAGVKFSTDLASNQFKDEAGEDLIFLRTRRNDWHYELGAGIDHYFHFFRLSVEIKAAFGLRDLQLMGTRGPIFYDPIQRLNSKNVMISFIFE